MRLQRFLLLFIACLGISAQAFAYGEEEHALEFVAAKRWQEAELAATGVRDPLIRDVVQFYVLRDSPQLSGFGEYATFIRDHPDWPNPDKLKRRAEIALITEQTGSGLLMDWFTDHPPVTARGKLYAAEMGSGVTAELARDAFINGDFTGIEESRVLDSYGQYLRMADYAARTDRLLWDGRVLDAKDMLPRLSLDLQALFNARIALMQKKKNADALLAKVPPSLRRDPGLLFERIRFRHGKDQDDAIPELLALAPADLPHSAKWWPYRRYAIREALDEGNYAQAAALTARHGQVDKVEKAEALFMSGWIDLSFRNRARPALDEFARLYALVEYPISKSRAAYWAGRAAAASNHPDAAKKWYAEAARYPFFFYGQLAQEELYGEAPLRLPANSPFGEADWQKGAKRDKRVQLCLNLARYGYPDLALPFLMHMAQSANTSQEAGMAVYTGAKMGRVDFTVRAAKEALNKGFVFTNALFPRLEIKSALAVDKPFAFAIARQESMFYPLARSTANAIGMMQLLPGTAKLVAKKNGLTYTASRLTEPEYNFTFGSLYLSELMERFDGRHVLAVAGYNAGPGRPSQWQERYGALTDKAAENVEWIERIPFTETRNYVQRVLENYQIYRWIESGGTSPNLAREMVGS